MALLRHFYDEIPRISNPPIESNLTPFMHVCSIGKWFHAEKLIDYIEDPIQKSGNGNTPLMYACYSGGKDVVKKLISKFGMKLKPDEINNNGSTALIIACDFGYRDIALLLLEKFGRNCNLNQRDTRFNSTAFDCIGRHNISIREPVQIKITNILRKMAEYPEPEKEETPIN